MSHEITIKNGVAQMAFVGKTPWHGLGQHMPIDASIDQWIEAAGFDFEILRAVVEYTPPGGVRTREVPGKVVLYASDDGTPLSVVSERFKEVQPRQIMEFFRDVTQAGGLRLHTAGMLNERTKYWAMAKNGGEGEVVPGDSVRLNILLATACDGSMATVAKPTAIRVVCANTLGMAMKDGRPTISLSHRSRYEEATIKRRLAEAYPAFGTLLDELRAIALKNFSPAQAKELLMSFLAKPSKAVEHEPARQTGEVVAMVPPAADGGADFARLLARQTPATPIKPADKDPRAVSRVLELYQGAGIGADHEGVWGTGWGLLNAMTQYVDHELGRTDNSRIDSAWFGRGDQMKTEFQRLLLAA